MFNLEWLERNPVLTFVCSSLILLYIYGISWTIVIVFTLFLLDVTFKDTQGERIYGKPLVNKDKPHTKGKIFLPPSGGFGEPTQHIRMSKNVSDNNEKRPTLQSLLYKKRTQPEREQYSRQPLTAIIKNNISLNSSPTIDLEKKKPLYQTFRSPASPSVNSPSILARRTGSPFVSKFSSSCVGLNNSGNGSPLNLSRNSSFSISRVSNPNPQEALEVHGSYLVNKSVLHSPSLEKSNLAQRHFSPSTNITFDVRSPRTDFSNKCSTESVVEALKLKSKRKRGLLESSEETCSKKKKDNDELDSTMQDLLPAEKQPVNEVLSSKRKTLDVTSTGIQCHLDDDDDDDDMIKKKSKIVNDEGSAKKKFGLSQGEINELSSDTDSIDGATVPKEISVGDGVKEIEKETADISFKEAAKNLACESSFKTVAFADSTPVKKQENIADTSSLKLSALKKMNSPYKKLFNSGATSNMSPALKKKMRKHPVYFTAKINIDEVQQHHEEFGESGVSLKAFRLDKEEAAKRVDSLFDESDSDVASKSESLPAATPTIPAAAEVKSTESIGLFASSKPAILSALAQPTASLSSSSPALTTLCFPVPSLTSTTIGTATTVSVPAVVSETVTSSDSGIQFKIEAPKLSASLSKPTAPTLGSFSFGTLPGASVSVGISSTLTSAVSTIQPVSTVSLNSQVTTSNKLGFSFGTANATAIATSLPPPSIQFTAPVKPAATVNAPSSETSKISFFTTQSSAATIAPTPIAPVAAVPLSTPSFSFSFNTSKTTEAPSSQLSTLPVISIAAPQPSTTASMFGSSAPAFNFGSSSTIPTIPAISSTSSLPTLFGQAAAAGTLFATLSNSVATTTLPSTVLSATTSAPSLTFSFGASASQPAAQSTPSIFGVQSTSAAASAFTFGASASTAAPAVAPAAVPVLAPAAALAAAPVTVSVPSFNPPSTSAGNIFAQVKPGGFSFTGSTTSGFTFGTNTSTPAAATTQSSIFGQAPAATVPTMPSTQPSQNIFGAPPATSSQSIFGTTPASSQSIFGAPVSTVPVSQGIFGSSTQSSFGSAATVPGAAPVFGAAPSGQSAFGAAPQQPSIFGDQSKPTGFSFGANPTSSAPSTGFSFGASTTQASSSMFGAPTTNVFGAQPNPTNSAGIFGQAKPTENVFAQQPKPSTGFDFSASLTQGPSLNFGNPAPAVNSGFAPQPQSEIPKPTFNFGVQPTTPSFASNTPASPAFGAAQPPAFASQPFGTSNPPGASGGFTIGTGGSNPPPTRQTQRARRRLRR